MKNKLMTLNLSTELRFFLLKPNLERARERGRVFRLRERKGGYLDRFDDCIYMFSFPPECPFNNILIK